jgi:hypothetical protein
MAQLPSVHSVVDEIVSEITDDICDRVSQPLPNLLGDTGRHLQLSADAHCFLFAHSPAPNSDNSHGSCHLWPPRRSCPFRETPAVSPSTAADAGTHRTVRPPADPNDVGNHAGRGSLAPGSGSQK